MKKGVAILNGQHENGKTFVVVGPVSMEAVRDLIGHMMMAKKKWVDEGRPNSGDFA